MKNILLLLLTAVFCACGQVRADTLTRAERARAVDHLKATRKAFQKATRGLSEAQWNFKPAPDRWSVAECAEHIAVSEDFIFSLIADKLMKSPAAPEKKNEVKGNDEWVLKMVPDRSRRFQAPEQLVPTRRWPTTKETMKHFLESRKRTVAYVNKTEEDLRAHFAPHPAGMMLDGYQWVLLISAHSARHTAQINEVKADPNFPKK